MSTQEPLTYHISIYIHLTLPLPKIWIQHAQCRCKKIRRFKLALLLVARIVALSPPLSIPFVLHTHRRQCLSSFSYRAIIFPYSRHPLPPLRPRLPLLLPPSSPPPSLLCFHPCFHSIPSSPRFESGMRSSVRKKGALKRFLLAIGTPTPLLIACTAYLSHQKRSLLLIVPPSLYSLILEFPSSSCFFYHGESFSSSSWSPPTSHHSLRMPDWIRRKGQPLLRFRHPRTSVGATKTMMIKKQG